MTNRIIGVVGVCAAALALALPTAASGRGAQLQFAGHSWHVYNGRGGDGQVWSSSHVSVSSGILHIAVSGGVGGGVSLGTGPAGGTYRVRFRMTAGAGSKYAILLWPNQGSRPELDFAEDERSDAPTRHAVMATYHPRPGCQGCVQLRTAVDMTGWHTLGVTHVAGGWNLTLDGRTWGHFSTSSTVPMHLAIQAESFASGPATRLDVAGVSAP